MISAEEDGSVAEEYMDNKLDEGERFNWLKRPLPSDALDYAAAEAKTILRLYQQVSKDNKTAASIMDTQSSIQTLGDSGGPFSPYKQQQSDRRRLLSEHSSSKLCPAPLPEKCAAPSNSSPAIKPAKVKKNKCSSWRMCLT